MRAECFMYIYILAKVDSNLYLKKQNSNLIYNMF
jgi:hypothetical protein